MRKEKVQALDSAAECLKKTLSAIQEIKDGTPEAVVCKKYGMTISAFRYLLFNKNLGYQGVQPRSLEEILLSPEENLFCDVFEIRELHRQDIPLDLVESVKFVCQQLGRKERRILFYRYWRSCTLTETAKRFGVSGDRIRQIQNKALRKLRHPYSANVLRFGLKYWEQKQEERKLVSERVTSKAVEKLKQQCKEAINRNDAEAVLDCFMQCQNFLNKSSFAAKVELISAMQLSIRPLNVLKRHGIYKIEELSVFKTIADLATIPNLGKRSIEEIRTKAATFGIIIKESNEVQKMCSVAASIATLAFNKNLDKIVDRECENKAKRDGTTATAEWIKPYRKALEHGAMFDARVFSIPREEVTNYFY